MKLMVGRGSGAGSISAMALLVVGATMALRAGSLKYRLRWLARTILSTSSGSYWSHDHGPFDNCIVGIDCAGPDLPSLVGAI